jgi:hypothetical protein
LAVFPTLARFVALRRLLADPAPVAAPSGHIDWATTPTLSAALCSTRAGVAAPVEGRRAARGVKARSGFAHQAVALVLTLAPRAVSVSVPAAGAVVALLMRLDRAACAVLPGAVPGAVPGARQ